MTIGVYFHVWMSGKDQQTGLPQVRYEEVAYCSDCFSWMRQAPFPGCVPQERRPSRRQLRIKRLKISTSSSQKTRNAHLWRIVDALNICFTHMSPVSWSSEQPQMGFCMDWERLNRVSTDNSCYVIIQLHICAYTYTLLHTQITFTYAYIYISIHI